MNEANVVKEVTEPREATEATKQRGVTETATEIPEGAETREMAMIEATDQVLARVESGIGMTTGIAPGIEILEIAGVSIDRVHQKR